MNRRSFIHVAAGAVSGLGARIGTADADRTVSSLVKWLEDSPRNRIPRDLARMIRSGLRREDLFAALLLAAVRNVQPYPDVGYKYHAVMMLRSIQLSTQHVAAQDRWLPIAWAADYFKDAQAQERADSRWRLPTQAAEKQASSPEAARRALSIALEQWDREAADRAIIQYARIVPMEEVFAFLFPYGVRDLRAIGHKAITLCNAHSLIGLGGSVLAEAVLRSAVAALQNPEGDPNPAGSTLEPDEPWRRTQERLREIPSTWKQGRDDLGARAELHAALFRSSAADAGALVIGLLQRGISPDAIWQVLFDVAAELLLEQPGIVLVHAQTTANALHYAYRVCADERAQQLMLLQCAAFMAMFRAMADVNQPKFALSALEPLPAKSSGADALAEIFSELAAGERVRAAQKSLYYLQTGGDADSLIAAARHRVVYHADEAHDYKFAEAVFDNYAQFAQADWQRRFLSAGMAYFKAPARRPGSVVGEMLELLKA